MHNISGRQLFGRADKKSETVGPAADRNLGDMVISARTRGYRSWSGLVLVLNGGLGEMCLSTVSVKFSQLAPTNFVKTEVFSPKLGPIELRCLSVCLSVCPSIIAFLYGLELMNGGPKSAVLRKMSLYWLKPSSGRSSSLLYAQMKGLGV